LRNALETLAGIRGVSYRWNERFGEVGNPGQVGQLQVGVIAQDVEKVLPEAVTTLPGGYEAVDYARLVPVLVEAMKELREEKDGQIRTLTAEIKAMRNQNAELARKASEASKKADEAGKRSADLEARMERLELMLGTR
jgi:hypothetical protein